MSVQPRTQEVDGEPVRDRTPPDGLYRYQPMPPAYRDADGYLVEDSMGRSDRHMCETSLWYHALTVRLPAATVCSNLFLHYRKGDRGATLVPDLFVALGVPPIEDRDNHKLWQDPVPDLAMEMLADSTTAKDECSKRDIYERLGGARVLAVRSIGPQARRAARRLPAAGRALPADRPGRHRPAVEQSPKAGPACAGRRAALPRSGDGRELADLQRVGTGVRGGEEPSRCRGAKVGSRKGPSRCRGATVGVPKGPS